MLGCALAMRCPASTSEETRLSCTSSSFPPHLPLTWGAHQAAPIFLYNCRYLLHPANPTDLVAHPSQKPSLLFFTRAGRVTFRQDPRLTGASICTPALHYYWQGLGKSVPLGITWFGICRAWEALLPLHCPMPM